LIAERQRSSDFERATSFWCRCGRPGVSARHWSVLQRGCWPDIYVQTTTRNHGGIGCHKQCVANPMTRISSETAVALAPRDRFFTRLDVSRQHLSLSSSIIYANCAACDPEWRVCCLSAGNRCALLRSTPRLTAVVSRRASDDDSLTVTFV
jgi:hypothetical protein